MSEFIIISPEDDRISELETKNRKLAREVAAEGIVLLHNDGVLPLKEKKIGLFGTGARMTVFGGTGSGETKGRGKITIEQGLINAGVEIESTLWMDEFDEKYKRERKAWKDDIESHIKGYHIWNVMDMFREIDKHHFVFPVGDEIQPRHVKATSEVAVYIIARQAGEGGDRRLDVGDYYLSDLEINSIRFLKEKYKQVVVLINSGGCIDCSFMDDEATRPDALLYIGQPGEETGNAVADILYGKKSPSGRLTATWAKKYVDFPGANHFGELSVDKLQANYEEGIFVGYRWFDAKEIESRFSFGYGISYTTFTHQYVSAKQEKDKLIFTFSVKNTGSSFSGKDVVQLYVSKPNDGIYQPKRELISFEKTRELAPGEETQIQIPVAIKDMTSFVEEKQCQSLLQGQYVFYEGDSFDTSKAFLKAMVGNTRPVKQFKKIESCPVNIEMDFSLDFFAKEESLFEQQEIPCINVDEMVLSYEVINYDKKENHLSDLVQKLTDKELCTMLVGGPVMGYGYVRAPGTVGRTSNVLWKKYHLPNINMADGPAGLNLIAQSLVTKRGVEKSYQHLPENWSYGFLKNMEWIAVGNPKKDRMVCQFTTAFPSTTVRTQTWNKELIYRVGEAVGKEMKAYGITLWLAPAINIQKNPLCGRNFEYASEDPLLSGYMAAAIIKGVQDCGGVGAVIKHFCANNQETQREYVSSNIEERALRDIYLKGFEIAIRESNPWAVMTSYNKLNGTYTANNKDLLVNVLRREWNYTGVVMTDWGAITKEKGAYYLCSTYGNDMIMLGDKGVVKQLMKDLKEKKLDRRAAMESVQRIIEMVQKSEFV